MRQQSRKSIVLFRGSPTAEVAHRPVQAEPPQQDPSQCTMTRSMSLGSRFERQGGDSSARSQSQGLRDPVRDRDRQLSDHSVSCTDPRLRSPNRRYREPRSRRRTEPPEHRWQLIYLASTEVVADDPPTALPEHPSLSPKGTLPRHGGTVSPRRNRCHSSIR